jgi:crotonobetainyl-CoA:carnitine CoA-transferase CaiB-like acyl-CoA transferase
VRRQAPVLGADSDTILRELGYAQDEIDRMRTAGAVAPKPGQARD